MIGVPHIWHFYSDIIGIRYGKMVLYIFFGIAMGNGNPFEVAAI